MRLGLLLTAVLVLPLLTGPEARSQLPTAPPPRVKVDQTPATPGVIRLGSDRFRVERGVLSGSMTADGTGFLVGSIGRIVQFDAKTGRTVREYPRSESIYDQRPALAGNILVMDAGQVLRRYDTTTGRLAGEWSGAPFDRHENFYCNHLSASADGKRVAFGHSSSVSKDGEPGRAWVVTFGDKPEVKEFTVLQHNGTWAALSTDGRTLVTGGQYAKYRIGENDDSPEYVQVWDVETGRERRRIRTSDILTLGGLLSPDGTRLLTLRKCEVWDVATGERVTGLRQPPLDVRGWHFSADGKSVHAMRHDGTIRVWATETGDQVRDYLPPAVPHSSGRRYGNGVAQNAQGRLIGFGWWGSVALAWDAERGELLTEARGIADAATRMVYAPDGRTVYLTGHGMDLLACRANGTGEPEEIVLTPLPGMTHDRRGSYYGLISFCPDGRRVIVVQPLPTGGAVVYDLTTRAALYRIPIVQPEVIGPLWSPDGKWLAFGGAYGHNASVKEWHPLLLIDTRTGKTRPIDLKVKGSTGVAFTADSSTLVVEHYVPLSPRETEIKTRIVAWDLATDRAKADVTFPGQPGGLLRWAGLDAKSVLLGFNKPGGYELAAWDTTTGKLGARAVFPFAERGGAAVDRHGRVAVAGLTAGGVAKLVLWDGTDQPPVELPVGHSGGIWALAFSPDGSTLATSGSDTMVIFRRVAAPVR